MSAALPEAAPPPRRKSAALRPDWWSKSLAGGLLGLTLALLISALLDLSLTGLPMSSRAQLVMWSVPPLWLTVASTVYFFASGRAAWLWLGGANLLVLGLWLLLRTLLAA